MFYLNPLKNNLYKRFHENFHDLEHNYLSQELALVNLSESDTAFHLSIQSPGLKKEDIQIYCDQKSILLEWEKKLSMEETHPSLEEISSYEKVSRQITLPALVKEDSVKAEYQDGMLYISLEKEPKAPSKKITVK